MAEETPKGWQRHLPVIRVWLTLLSPLLVLAAMALLAWNGAHIAH